MISYNNYLIKLTATQAIFPRGAPHSIITSQEPIGNSPGLTVSQQFTCPNTAIHYTLFTPNDTHMPAGPLNFNEWKKHRSTFPDRRVTSAILGICHYGARIGYEGPRDSISIYPNLTTAEEDKEIVFTAIASDLANNRLKYYENRLYLPACYRVFPLGLGDKSDGLKRRIHHLSYPPEEESSINCGIPEH